MLERDNLCPSGSDRLVPALIALALLVLTALFNISAFPPGALAQGEPPSQEPPVETPEEGPPIAPPPTSESFVMNLYFYLNGELVGAPRSNIPGGGQMVEFAIKDLLDGPTEEERAQGYETYIPPGVKLMYSTKSMVGSSYSVNLSGELMQLAGNHDSAVKALSQIIRTLREAAHTDDVRVTVNISDTERDVDALEALGVKPSEVGLAAKGTGEGKGSRLWLYLLIIIGVVLLAEAALIPLFLRARRQERAFLEEIEAGGAR